MNLLSSYTATLVSRVRISIGFSSSTIPASKIIWENVRAPPSATGGSGASISRMQLSIRSAKSAERICSTVKTFASPRSSVVARSVFVTNSLFAGTSGAPVRSIRRKMMPLPAGAGRIVIVTGIPEWSPFPLKEIGFPRVY